MQEDALNLFNAALREYVGVYHVSAKESKHQEWAITGLSVSASKIVDIPSVSHSDFVSQASCLYPYIDWELYFTDCMFATSLDE